MSGSRGYRWLAVVPPLSILVGAPLANGVHRYFLGLPFILFWIVACVLLTSATLGVIAALDRRADASPAPPRGPGEPSGSDPGAR